MTSQEIKAIVEPIRQFDCHGEATRQLLATYEIAYQLAVMNERNAAGERETVSALIGQSVPSPSSEPAGQDSSPLNSEGYNAWLDCIHAQALLKKTDREQNS